MVAAVAGEGSEDWEKNSGSIFIIWSKRIERAGTSNEVNFIIGAKIYNISLRYISVGCCFLYFVTFAFCHKGSAKKYQFF